MKLGKLIYVDMDNIFRKNFALSGGLDPKSNPFQPFKRQSHKMVKHTQTIRRQQPTNCLSVYDHFVKLAFRGLKNNIGVGRG